MKKTFLFSLLLMLVGLTQINAEKVLVDGFYFELGSNNTAKVTFCGNEVNYNVPDNVFYEGDLVVPSKFTYDEVEYTVVGATARAFQQSKATSVEFSAGCTEFADATFQDAKSLVYVKYAEGAKITSWSYYGCDKLEYVIFPSTADKFGTYQNGGLNNATIYVPKANIASFRAVSSYTFVAIEDFGATEEEATVGGLKYLIYGSEATLLKDNYSGDLVIPATISYKDKTVDVVAMQALNDLSGLTSVVIEAPLKALPAKAFSNCANVKSIVLPNTIETFEERVFELCTNLTTINIPTSLKGFKVCAFEHCKNLSSPLEFPACFTTFDDWTFNDCGKLTSITIYAENPPSATGGGTNLNNFKEMFVPEASYDKYITATRYPDASKIKTIESVTRRADLKKAAKDALELLKDIQYEVGQSTKNLITDASQFSTNAEQSGLGNLLVDNYSSLYQTWPGYGPVGEEYLQVNLVSNPVKDFTFSYATYNKNPDGGADAPAKFIIQGSTNGSDWEDITTITEGLPNTPSTDYTSATIQGSKYYAALRFTIPSHQAYRAYTDDRLWAMAKFQINALEVSYPDEASEALAKVCIEAIKVAEGNVDKATFESYINKINVAVKGCTQKDALYENVQINGVNYYLKASSAYVIKSADATGDVVIPSEVEYDGYTFTVVGIDGLSFQNNSNITSVVMPNTITGFTAVKSGNDAAAFEHCANLTSVTLSEALSKINSWTFNDCPKLKSITVPGSVSFLGGRALSTSNELEVTILSASKVDCENNTVFGSTKATVYVKPMLLDSYNDDANYSGCDIHIWKDASTEDYVKYEAKYGAGQLVTHKSQLKTNASSYDISVLIDGNLDNRTENWSAYQPNNEKPYLQVNIPERPVTGVYVNFVPRNDGYYKADAPKTIVVTVSNDGTNWTEVATLAVDGEKIASKTWYTTEAVEFGGEYGYIRCTFPESFENRDKGIVAFGEFNLTEIDRTMNIRGTYDDSNVNSLIKIIKSIPGEVNTLDLTNATINTTKDIEVATNGLIILAEGSSVGNDHNVVVDGVCESLILTDGEPFKPGMEFKAEFAGMAKTVESGWYTLVLPYTSAIPEGAKAYTFKGINGSTVEFEAIVGDVIPANTPVLIKSGNGQEADFAFCGEDCDIVLGDMSEFAFQGTYTEIPAGKATGKYILNAAGTAFGKATAIANIPAFRCFLTKKATSSGVDIKDQPTDDDARANVLNIVIVEPTGVKTTLKGAEAAKVFGILGIESESNGVNIKDGKKYMK
ncbi:MAG: leucine-rich repeat protein [Prevotellaceae bacterium]|nr:leucine-rich repeat protein [Candidatus Faecinaster equi]